MSAMTSRRMRAFKRWMSAHGVVSSDALGLVDSGDEEGIWVRALCPLREGDLVASIPKEACLTTRTTGSCDVIEAAGLGGSLGLAVALMYERSLGEESPWAGYLQLLPEREEVPLVWSLEEVDELLKGTELHRMVKEDKALLYEDWKENIWPLVESGQLKGKPDCFGPEQYFSAKSLVASRSFDIDNYHGSGMVPLADLFNHKTGAEDVHFTSVCSMSSSDDEGDDGGDNGDGGGGEHDRDCGGDNGDEGGERDRDCGDGIDTDDKSAISDLYSDDADGDDPTKLEMVIVQDVEAGAEVFNTYGTMGNAALLHRYGFTEPENPFDIVNVDLQLVTQWGTSSFTSRHFRRRLSLWRRLQFSGCLSQNSEYFEIAADGEPQQDLLALLYIMHLSEEAYQSLEQIVDSFKDLKDEARLSLLTKSFQRQSSYTPENLRDLLFGEDVCHALMALADTREMLYGAESLEDDLNKLMECCCVSEKKRYHSLVLRVSERTILANLRDYVSCMLKTQKM